MTKSRFLLLDANVVIRLFEMELWDAVASRRGLVLPSLVVRESDFFVDAAGVERPIDLRPDIDTGRITVMAATEEEMKAYRERFDDLYVQRLHDGETEALICCERRGEECRLCSADAVVFRVLALLDRREQGVSLQELLDEIGLSRTVTWPFTKAFREEKHREGVTDRLAGIGLRRR